MSCAIHSACVWVCLWLWVSVWVPQTDAKRMLPGYGFSSGSGVLLIFLLSLLLFWIFVILIYSFGDVLLKFDHANDQRALREPATATGAGHGHITEQSNWSQSDTRNEAVTPKRTYIKTHMELVYRNCKWMRLKVVFKQRNVVKLSSISAFHTLRISDMWIAWMTHESVIDIVYVVYYFAHMNTDELQDICTASTLEWSALSVIYVLAVKRFPFIVLEWVQPQHCPPLSHATCVK